VNSTYEKSQNLRAWKFFFALSTHIIVNGTPAGMLLTINVSHHLRLNGRLQSPPWRVEFCVQNIRRGGSTDRARRFHLWRHRDDIIRHVPRQRWRRPSQLTLRWRHRRKNQHLRQRWSAIVHLLHNRVTLCWLCCYATQTKINKSIILERALTIACRL